ncbi:uncharacterized protein H6S33_007066 [Morchella sextelata]|uniref:uncharacterized protein n=1 Tax=Morchella sextelata TaxID=1174677 RepID=UPI001D04065A|nr:uncharacterized protein H6S33_007066 [Morchella sextelata]KAH0604035.1 hypothetical protein H6S33_007066 [Morchella sextelata]
MQNHRYISIDPALSSGFADRPTVFQYSQTETPDLTTTSTRYTNEDIELFIDWFSSDLRNFKLYKTKAKDALLKIFKNVFGGRHSTSTIKGKWDKMKEKHRQVRAKLESTGKELDDILIRDKSYTTHYVSETGELLHLQVFNGNSQQSMPTIPKDEPVTDEENPDGLEFHSPAGGQKNTLKHGESGSGSGKHTGAIKKLKKSSGEEILWDYQLARLDFERERFVYEKERDREDRKLLVKKEENRNLETMRRFDYVIKKMEMMDSSQVNKNKD